MGASGCPILVSPFFGETGWEFMHRVIVASCQTALFFVPSLGLVTRPRFARLGRRGRLPLRDSWWDGLVCTA